MRAFVEKNSAGGGDIDITPFLVEMQQGHITAWNEKGTGTFEVFQFSC